jgi:ABC-type transport system involved in multi-copper enzyme maturation permease subunit
MFKHFRKDLVQHKKFLVFSALFYPLYLGFFGSRYGGGRAAALLTAVLLAFIPITLFSREAKFKAAAFSLSLPTTRAELLRARYALSWGLMIALYIASGGVAAVFPGGKLPAGGFFEIRAVLMALALTALVFAAIMPLLIRFGWAGLIAFLVGMQVLGIALLGAASFLKNGRALTRFFKAVLTFIPRTIDGLLSSAGSAGTAALVLAAALAVTAASYGLSLAVFKTREF